MISARFGSAAASVSGRRRAGGSRPVNGGGVAATRRLATAVSGIVSAAAAARFDASSVGQRRLFGAGVEALLDERCQESLFGQHGEESEDEGVVVVGAPLVVHAVLSPLLHFVLEILFASGNLRLQLAQEGGEIGEILGGERGGRRLWGGRNNERR